MDSDDSDYEIFTRRKAITGGGAIVVGGVLAGCTGGQSATTPTATAEDTKKETESSKKETSSTKKTAASTGETASTTGSPTPYEVTVKPSGSYTFEKIPETYMTIPGVWLDMAMGFGIQPAAVGSTARLPTTYYEALPGVTFNEKDITSITKHARGQYDKEVFYNVDADVHLMDPRLLKQFSGWDDADLEEIEKNIAPILGSFIRFPYRGQERYYTLYEAFEKVAKIFQRQEQYDAWVGLKKQFYSDIKSKIPVTGPDAPTVAVLAHGFQPESGKFLVTNIYAPRNDTRNFRLLGVNSAFKGKKYMPWSEIGYEELLEVDPDYLAVLTELAYSTEEEFQQTIEAAKNHPVLSEVTAVEKGNIVRTAGDHMGPIIDLFSTEALAKQLYPDEYGKWPGSIKKIPQDEQLFDRKRVADIIHGNI